MGALAKRALTATVILAFAIAATSRSAPARKGGPETAQRILATQLPAVLQEFEQTGLVMLEGTSAEGHVRALVRFEQPRRRVIRLLAQTARHHEFRPELREIESHSWDETGALDTHRMRIMFMNIDYRLRTHFDWEGNRIWWELDPEFENGLEVVEGFWELFDIDGQNTLGRFGTRVSVGAGLPNWFQDMATRKNVPEAMENVKRWVDVGGR
ncbi:MAG: hypothetical protein JRH16_17940 [Deltaproteobacteria bacterium]|nr:hypothetical protein [Deltaproteobacteria bacterium]MBW2362757.1 hypothetical protein [Deltaproteobacteria bacterium]